MPDTSLYQRDTCPPMSSVRLERKLFDEWYEVVINDKPYLFDDAIEELRYAFMRVKVEEITILKHHANTWGLSSSNWLAEKILPKLKNLKKLDFSETLGRPPRSDICHSFKSMLEACSSFRIQ